MEGHVAGEGGLVPAIREAWVTPPCHCEERSDEAISFEDAACARVTEIASSLRSSQ